MPQHNRHKQQHYARNGKNNYGRGSWGNAIEEGLYEYEQENTSSKPHKNQQPMYAELLGTHDKQKQDQKQHRFYVGEKVTVKQHNMDQSSEGEVTELNPLRIRLIRWAKHHPGITYKIVQPQQKQPQMYDIYTVLRKFRVRKNNGLTIFTPGMKVIVKRSFPNDTCKVIDTNGKSTILSLDKFENLEKDKNGDHAVTARFSLNDRMVTRQKFRGVQAGTQLTIKFVDQHWVEVLLQNTSKSVFIPKSEFHYFDTDALDLEFGFDVGEKIEYRNSKHKWCQGVVVALQPELVIKNNSGCKFDTSFNNLRKMKAQAKNQPPKLTKKRITVTKPRARPRKLQPHENDRVGDLNDNVGANVENDGQYDSDGFYGADKKKNGNTIVYIGIIFVIGACCSLYYWKFMGQ